MRKMWEKNETKDCVVLTKSKQKFGNWFGEKLLEEH